MTSPSSVLLSNLKLKIFASFCRHGPQAARIRIQPFQPTVVNYLKFPTYLTSPPVKFWYRSLNSLCNIVRKNTRAVEQMPNPEVLGNSTARGRELSMDISHKSLGGRRRPVSIKGLVRVRSPGDTPGNSWWGCATRFSKS